MSNSTKVTWEARKRTLAKRILESDDRRTIADLEYMVGDGGPLRLTVAQKVDLDEALDRYLSGKEPVHTWEEVKARVQARLMKSR